MIPRNNAAAGNHRSSTWTGRVALGWTLALLFLAHQAGAEKPSPPRLQSIESAIQAASYATRPVPVVVRGIVTLSQHQFVIEDRTGATDVNPLNPVQIALGDEVEVSGEMTLDPRPRVRNAQVRPLWGGSMPLPLSITADEAAGGENEYFLVQTTAVLVGVSPAGLTGIRLNLRAGHQNFSAVLVSDSAGGDLASPAVRPGATLSLTGILMVNRGSESDHAGAFTLELRSPDDIQVLEPPSWWTGPHLILLGGALVIVILLGVNGYYRLQHARYRAVAEERANIARDIHDTVAQGYAGIALQLEAAKQMIGRDPERAEGFLIEALHLVRHSRDESHLSIDVLRSLSRNDRLEVLLVHCIQQMQPASHAAIEMQVTGQPLALSFKLVNNLFRIAQQGMVNAVHHAAAGKIVVRIAYGRREVLLEVEDDGKGFDPETAKGMSEGHFGLTGMRERCRAMQSKLELESSQKGTLIRVRVEP